jgi:hypothetical protein
MVSNERQPDRLWIGQPWTRKEERRRRTRLLLLDAMISPYYRSSLQDYIDHSRREEEKDEIALDSERLWKKVMRPDTTLGETDDVESND